MGNLLLTKMSKDNSMNDGIFKEIVLEQLNNYMQKMLFD